LDERHRQPVLLGQRIGQHFGDHAAQLHRWLYALQRLVATAPDP
jgi:hypothetical protein